MGKRRVKEEEQGIESTSEKKSKKARKEKKKKTKEVRRNSSTIRSTATATTTASASTSSSPPLFYRKRVQLTTSLLPWSLKNCKQAVEGSIKRMLMKYSDGLGGIFLAYDNIQLQGDENSTNNKGKGWILNELPYIHYQVTCDALVFAPTVGCEVRPFFPLQMIDLIEFHIVFVDIFANTTMMNHSFFSF